jgi:hypothetical protein
MAFVRLSAIGVAKVPTPIVKWPRRPYLTLSATGWSEHTPDLTSLIV